MLEHFFQCPYCWEQISVLLDGSVGEATFIEDCEVCCNPLEFNVKFNQNELTFFEVNQFQ